MVNNINSELYMGFIKTTIIIDEETWSEFKKIVSLRYGNLRMISHAIEEAIKCFNVVEVLKGFSNAMGLAINEYPSSNEVKEKRPKLNSSAGKEVRRMRDERQNRLFRFE
ncbi:MAG: hypothetical protein QXZ53_04245 [Candidatus Bathyarchaeia archaeon]